MKRGLLELDLAGRLQVLPGRPAVVLDVAHNPHAARVLADGLGNMGYYRETLAVFSMLADKDIRGVVRETARRIDRWLIAPIGHARGASLDVLAQSIGAVAPAAQPGRYSGIAAAYAAACEFADQDDRIVVFGSFYTVADVLRVRRDRPSSASR